MMETKRWILRDSTILGRIKVFLDAAAINRENPVEVVIKPYKKNRSLSQNNLLWMWLTEISRFLDGEHGLKVKPEDLKTEFQERFLGLRTYSTSTGGFRQTLIGTSRLNTAQFTEFLSRIEVYARSELGCALSHPEDIWYEAMGVAA